MGVSFTEEVAVLALVLSVEVYESYGKSGANSLPTSLLKQVQQVVTLQWQKGLGNPYVPNGSVSHKVKFERTFYIITLYPHFTNLDPWQDILSLSNIIPSLLQRSLVSTECTEQTLYFAGTITCVYFILPSFPIKNIVVSYAERGENPGLLMNFELCVSANIL